MKKITAIDVCDLSIYLSVTSIFCLLRSSHTPVIDAVTHLTLLSQTNFGL